MPTSTSSYKARVSPTKYDTSASSEDGSLGPRDNVVPFVPEKKMAPLTQPALTHTVRISLPGAKRAGAKIAPRVTVAPKAPENALEESLALALTFLTFDEIEVARTATPALAAAAERVAPKPLPCDGVAFVRWEPREADVLHHGPHHGAHKPAHGAPAVFPWRCLNCGEVTVGPRACGSCGAQLASSACRAFLGQLRKDLSAELATALLRMLVPDVTILHVESHTNAVDGRGKGCAWVYVNTVEDALRVTSLHKRVFVDLDADNGEGYWFVQDAGLKGHLGAMADILAAQRGRPVWLPRQPLVAELPAKSMLAEYARTLGYQQEQ